MQGSTMALAAPVFLQKKLPPQKGRQLNRFIESIEGQQSLPAPDPYSKSNFCTTTSLVTISITFKTYSPVPISFVRLICRLPPSLLLL